MSPSPAPPATAALVVSTGASPTAARADLGDVVFARGFEVVETSWWEGVPADGANVVAAVRALLRAGIRQVGVGCGLVPTGLARPPADSHSSGSDGSGSVGPVGGATRVGATPAGTAAPGPSARPPAHAAARVALAAAHRTHQGVALRASRGRGRTGPPPKDVEDAETCLWLLADLWHRRSPEGWAVADLMDAGLTGRECAQRLDISPSAVSQRAAAARYVEGRRAADLAGRLLDGLIRQARTQI